jgi:hypothetical protein
MLRWSPPLGRLPGAEVVAAACEAAVAEVVASAGEPLGGEAIVAAGESSVQRWPLSSVLRWSPPLASRSELATTRPYWCGGSSYL